MRNLVRSGEEGAKEARTAERVERIEGRKQEKGQVRTQVRRRGPRPRRMGSESRAGTGVAQRGKRSETKTKRKGGRGLRGETEGGDCQRNGLEMAVRVGALHGGRDNRTARLTR